MVHLNLAFEIIALQSEQVRLIVRAPHAEWTIETASPFNEAEQREWKHAPVLDDNYLRRFGQRLFDFLIKSDPRTQNLFNEMLADPRTRLRLLLETERAGWLSDALWESLYDEASGFLALSPRIPITRAYHELSLRPASPLITPLKVLVVVSAPPNYPYLNIDLEWEALERATNPLQSAGLLHLERLEHTTWPALKRRLRADDFQVLHFIGFSQVDVLTGQAFLAFEDDSYASGSSTVSGIELGHELGPQSTVRLVYLDNREAAPQASLQLASQILKAGVASVVTNQFPLSPSADELFVWSLYQPLCEAHPLDAALNVARHALADHTSYAWASPSLFLRARDSILFRPVASLSVR